MESELLTAKEAAKYLHLSEKWGVTTLQQWVREGLIKSGRVGKHYVFLKEDLNAFAFSKR